MDDWNVQRDDLCTRLTAKRQEIYLSGKVERRSGKAVDVWPVGLSRERGLCLLDLVVDEQAKTCIETGMAYAMSTSYLLQGCLQNATSRPEAAIVISVDPFEETDWGGAGARFIEDCGAASFHRNHPVPSELLLPQLVRDEQRFDFAFIDGDHRFEHVFTDIFYARRLVRPDGLIVVDDAWMPSVQKAVRFFCSSQLCTHENDHLEQTQKLFCLRVSSIGDGRPWDHFSEF